MVQRPDLLSRLITRFHRASLPIPLNDQPHLENGRLFHGFRKGIYMYPCDEVKLRRRVSTVQAGWLTAVFAAARKRSAGYIPQTVSGLT